MNHETAYNRQKYFLDKLKSCYKLVEKHCLTSERLNEETYKNVFNNPEYKECPITVHSFINGANHILEEQLFKETIEVRAWRGKLYSIDCDITKEAAEWYKNNGNPLNPLVVSKKNTKKVFIGDEINLQIGFLFTVQHNPRNNNVTITNTQTNESWNLMPYEFVYNSINFNDVVDRFPKYVHELVWEFSDRYSKMIKEINSDK